MSENDSDEKKLEEAKSIEFFGATLNAWYTTKLEHDRSLLTLSAGGVGLLLTLLTAVGVSTSEALVLYILAIVSFLISMISILWIFKSNADYLERCVSNDAKLNDPLLAGLDKAGLLSFGIGVVFTTVIGISTAVHSYSENQKKEQIMSKEVNEIKEEVLILRESLNRALAFKPSTASPPPAPPQKVEDLPQQEKTPPPK